MKAEANSLLLLCVDKSLLHLILTAVSYVLTSFSVEIDWLFRRIIYLSSVIVLTFWGFHNVPQTHPVLSPLRSAPPTRVTSQKRRKKNKTQTNPPPT